MKISKDALKVLITEEVKKLEKVKLLKEEKAKVEKELKTLNEDSSEKK